MANLLLGCMQAKPTAGAFQDRKPGTVRQKDMRSKEVGMGKKDEGLG